jgi:hydrogenase expression/formation protein HypE
LQGKLAFTTDSFVISPNFFPGGNIGELAVNGTVNDIAMCGAVPKYLSLGFIIEEGLSVADLTTILIGIKKAADKAGVKVVTGDTKVVEKGKGDKIFINTTGIGVVDPKSNINYRSVKAGDAVIVSGNIATHGVAIMSQREGLEFETTVVSDTTNLNYLVSDMLAEAGDHIHFLRDPTRGGVASVLNELAKLINLGIQLNQVDLPVDPQVEGACEMLGLDPLYVANEGIFIAVVDPKSAEKVLSQILQTDPNARKIGEIVKDHPGKVLVKSSIGGLRVCPPLVGEQLPRIC